MAVGVVASPPDCRRPAFAQTTSRADGVVAAASFRPFPNRCMDTSQLTTRGCTLDLEISIRAIRMRKSQPNLSGTSGYSADLPQA